MITKIEDYFSLGCGRCERFATADCSTQKWAGGLLALRQLCIDMTLVETVKWAHPCYMHKDRNIAIIGALRDDFRISFFNALCDYNSETTPPHNLVLRAEEKNHVSGTEW